jgi:hypothetical protein
MERAVGGEGQRDHSIRAKMYAAKGLGLDGKDISAEAQAHYLDHRFKCRNPTCGTEFCAQCGTVPYHKGFECARYVVPCCAMYKYKGFHVLTEQVLVPQLVPKTTAPSCSVQ